MLKTSRFFEDIKNHKMEIIQDNEVNRHLLFKDPKDSNCYFGLVTWGGHLSIYGDMGCYVFERVHDMFNFFRMKKHDFNYDKNKALQINPGYWHEKLISDSKHRPAVEFSEEVAQKIIEDHLDRYCEDNTDLDDDFKSGCLEQAKDCLYHIGNEHELRDTIDKADWPEYCNSDQMSFADSLKEDFWEHDLRDFTGCYIWCLYAIVWGIGQYDKVKEDKEER